VRLRSRTGYNRRVITETEFGGRLVCAVAGVTFVEDGGNWYAVVQLNSAAAIRGTANPADLVGWSVIRWLTPSSFGALTALALEPMAPNATGSRFRLELSGWPGDDGGVWKLLIPGNQQFVTGVSGQPLGGYDDAQGTAPPVTGTPFYVQAAHFGAFAATGWTINSAVTVGGNDIDVTTSNPANDPFTITDTSGWTLNGGNAVSSIADQGSGVLRLTLANAPNSGDVLAVANGCGVTGPNGEQSITSYAVIS
jgi:hypothetical protein